MADHLPESSPAWPRKVQLSSPSQPLFCQDLVHQFSSLDARNSYDIINSQSQLLRERPQVSTQTDVILTQGKDMYPWSYKEGPWWGGFW